MGEKRVKAKGEVWGWARIGSESWILAKQLLWRVSLDGWMYRTAIVLGGCVAALLGVLGLYLVLNIMSGIDFGAMIERVPVPQGDMWRQTPSDMLTWLTTVVPQIKYIGVFWAWLPASWKLTAYNGFVSLGSF